MEASWLFLERDSRQWSNEDGSVVSKHIDEAIDWKQVAVSIDREESRSDRPR